MSNKRGKQKQSRNMCFFGWQRHYGMLILLTLFTYISPPSWWSFSRSMLEIECVNKLSANGAAGLAIIIDRIIRENHSS